MTSAMRAQPLDDHAKAPAGLRAVAATFGLAIAAMGVFFLCLHALWTQQRNAARWVDHTLEVLSAVDRFDRDFATALSEGRGLVIFNNWDRTANFEADARQSVDDIARLRALTADNATQRQILGSMASATAERMAFQRELIRRARNGSSNAAVPSVAERQRSWTTLAEINAGCEALRQEERRLLDQRRRDAQRAGMEVWGALIGLALASAACFTLALSLQAARGRDRRHVAELSRLNERLERMTQNLIKARDAAERSNRAKTHFLAGMSHELRTPLNGILGYTRLLSMEGGLNSTQAMRVDAMLAAGRHLLHMISRVLDLSEIEAERLELQNELIDVRAAAAACIDLVRPDAERKRLALTLDVGAHSPRHIVGDAMRLQQILVNLLGNAVKFTSAGKVEVRLLPVPDDSGIRIEVADTGPGIPADQRARLFQDFVRLDTAATRAAEGAGLGLSLSARLAAFMDGRMGLEDRPGGGSIFWLELPMTNAGHALAGGADTIEPMAPDSMVDSRPMTILVVDDVLMNRDIAGSILRAAGHNVTCVEGGAEAIAAVSATVFDVVLMDVRMPEMDGLEATRRIRASEGTGRRVPILALTAQAFTEQIAECREAGMDGHLGKPFDAETLLAAVVRAASALPAPPDATDGATPRGRTPILGEELPVFDQEGFDRTAAFLAPEKVGTYLQAVAANADALLQGLRATDKLTHHSRALADTAHAVASSAGMLGFTRAAALSRRFEHAVQGGAPCAQELADGLAAALEATLHDMKPRIDAAGKALPPQASAAVDAGRLQAC